MFRCERCGEQPEGKFGLHDYCATCSKNLCPACMAKGCCGKVPAVSGDASDHQDDADREMLGSDADHFDGEIGNK